MNSDIQLKSCPFCGGDVHLKFDDASDYVQFHEWYVECGKCKLVGYSAKTKEEVLNKWNFRIEINLADE